MLQKKSLLKDQGGSTLVEIIISVLIVGIAFVPLMMGLNSALTANRQTEKELYAENVASNVAEVCKTYGVKGLNEMAAATESSKQISAIFTGSSLVKDSTEDKFTISGITAGTGKEYKAVVTFSDAKYNTAPTAAPSATPLPSQGPRQNDFSDYPSLSGIDQACIVSFAEDNLSDIVSYYQGVAASHGGHVVEADMLANVDKWLKREITVTISNGAEGVVVNKATTYSIDPSATINTQSVFGSLSSSIDYPSQVEEVGNYSSLPSKLILTYAPIKNSSGVPISLMEKDIITIDKSTPGSINVYCLCQEGSKLKTLGGNKGQVFINCTDASQDADGKYYVKTYSNLNYTLNAVEEITKFGDGALTKQSRMKDADITIYDREGNPVINKTVTVIEFE